MKIIKNIFFSAVVVIGIICNASAQDEVAYGLKLPTEEELKQVPYTPSFGLPTDYNLPYKVDLSNQMPPVEDQGKQGSCTAFAIAYALKSYQEKKQHNWNFIENGVKKKDRLCSPAFVFNTAKRMTGNNNCREGISFYEGFQVLKEYGTTFWETFPYSELNCTNLPNQTILNKAAINKISSHKAVNFNNLEEVKYNLSVENPVIIGIILDDFFHPDGVNAFKNKQHYTFVPKGILKPSNYHAMLCVGYDEATQSFKVLNSWGENWGNSGFVDIPYKWFPSVVKEAYIMNDALNYSLFVNVENEETEIRNTKAGKAVQDSVYYSSWFKEGYYREIDNLRLGLTYLDDKSKSASVVITDLKTNEENVVNVKLDEPLTFFFNDQWVTFTLNDIKRAGRNPFNKAAFFEISVDKRIDKVLVDKLKNIKLLVEQKELIDKVIDKQNDILNQK